MDRPSGHVGPSREPGGGARREQDHHEELPNLDTSVLPATQKALETAQVALGGVRDVTSPSSPVRYNFEETMKELSAAARSLRDLAEFLEQNPNALILGKPGRREEE